MTEAILDEYRDVLSRPEVKIGRGLRNQLLDLIRSRARAVKPSRIPPLTKDPDDNKFLECADASRADYLATGNPEGLSRLLEKDQGGSRRGSSSASSRLT